MSLKSPELDVLVLGGGMLGVGVAALAAQRGYRVALLRLSDEDRPRADTLRNQGWLQSGMMYVDKFKGNRIRGLRLAKKMYHWGQVMLRRLDLPIPDRSDGAVLRVNNLTEGEQVLRNARELKISKFVSRLTDSEARTRLGDLFEDSSLYYGLPDIPFDEAAVLTRFREIAVKEGAELLNTKSGAHLVADSTSPGGFHCEWEGGSINAKVTVTAAGAANCPMLKELGLSNRTTLRQTPLLVVHDHIDTSVPIFIDKTRGFSFVRQPLNGASPAAALVVGTNVHREVTFHAAEQRRIVTGDINAFKKCLPSLLEGCVSSARFTAGYEFVPDSSSKESYLEPWVEEVSGFSGLILASPGRATLGWYTARQVMQRISRLLGAPRTAGGSHGSFLGRTTWTDEIHMHFEPYYSFDDSK